MVSIMHASPIMPNLSLLSCRDRYDVKSSDFDKVNNMNIVRTNGWSMLTVYRGAYRPNTAVYHGT